MLFGFLVLCDRSQTKRWWTVLNVDLLGMQFLETWIYWTDWLWRQMPGTSLLWRRYLFIFVLFIKFLLGFQFPGSKWHSWICAACNIPSIGWGSRIQSHSKHSHYSQRIPRYSHKVKLMFFCFYLGCFNYYHNVKCLIGFFFTEWAGLFLSCQLWHWLTGMDDLKYL